MGFSIHDNRYPTNNNNFVSTRVHHRFLVGSVLLVFFSFPCCVLFALFVFVLCYKYPMLPVSLNCPFLIASSVFSNVYSQYILLFKVNIFDITQHDETDFSDAVVISIIRGWAQDGKNERPVKSARIRSRQIICYCQYWLHFQILIMFHVFKTPDYYF